MISTLIQIQALAVLFAAALGAVIGNGWGKWFHQSNRGGEGRICFVALVGFWASIMGAAVGAGFYVGAHRLIANAGSSVNSLPAWTIAASAIAAVALFVLRESLDRKAFVVSFALERELARLRLPEREFATWQRTRPR